jgi:DNA polymerase-3 subunit delta'
VLIVEPGELGSIKIEQVRDVVDRAGYRPFEGRRRVVIIDEAHALVDAAQNALLKTLEEPPAASVFVLISSMPDSLLPTVLSRCQRLRFGELSAADVADALIRDHDYEESDARAAAVDAEGSIGRALSAASADVSEAREMALRLLEQTARTNDPGRLIDVAREVTPAGGGKTSGGEAGAARGVPARARLSARDIGLVNAQGETAVLANADRAPQLQALARSFDSDRTVRAYAAVNEALDAIEGNAGPKCVADWLVLQL